jgi:hypothetical protein
MIFAGLRSVDQPTLVRLVQPFRNLGGILEELRRGKRSLREARLERFALQPFHNKIVDSVLLSDIVHRTDAGMIQTGGSARLTLEAQPSAFIGREVGWKDLDGHSTIKTRVAGLVYLAHAASARRRENLIRS